MSAVALVCFRTWKVRLCTWVSCRGRVVEKRGAMSEPPPDGEVPPRSSRPSGGGASSPSPSVAPHGAPAISTYNTYWGSEAFNARCLSTSSSGQQTLPQSSGLLLRGRQHTGTYPQPFGRRQRARFLLELGRGKSAIFRSCPKNQTHTHKPLRMRTSGCEVTTPPAEADPVGG